MDHAHLEDIRVLSEGHHQPSNDFRWTTPSWARCAPLPFGMSGIERAAIGNGLFLIEVEGKPSRCSPASKNNSMVGGALVSAVPCRRMKKTIGLIFQFDQLDFDPPSNFLCGFSCFHFAHNCY